MARKRKAQANPIVSEEEDETSNDEIEQQVESEEDESSSEEQEESSESSSDDEESKKEDLLTLLEPFNKDQIIDLLKEAASKDSKLLSSIIQVADSDPTHRKIFIHGLSWDATSDQLLSSFKPFGEIEDSKLVTDKATGKAKGYAFVVFKTRAGAKRALKVPQKQIGNRMVSCQLASAGKSGGGGGGSSVVVGSLEGGGGGSRKMYVGNVGPHVNPEKLKEFFRRYGEIEELPIGVDFVTNRFKGFAVITFRNGEGFRKAMEEPMKVFDNCQLHCKPFVEKENRNNVVNNVDNNNSNQVSSQVANVVPSYGNLGGLGLGMNNPMLGASLNALMGQNLGMGLGGNPLLGTGFNPGSMMGAGMSAPFAGMGSNYGMNGIGSGVLPVMGNYGSQAALQGLGPYQNSLTGQSSVGTPTPTTTAVRAPENGISPPKSFTAYFRRT